MTSGGAVIQVPLERVDVDRALAWRDELRRFEGGESLLASVARRGILTAVTLRPAARGLHQPAAGFRRLEAARTLGLVAVPARIDEADPAELFFTAVEEHAGQASNLRERARAVTVAAGLLDGDPDRAAQLTRRLLPALGLHPSARLVDQHLRFAALHPALVDLLVDKAFSLRRCLPYCDLRPADAELLARLGRAHRLGGRRLEEAFTWSLEIARRDGASLGEVVDDLDLLGQDGEALDRLEARRLPEATRRRETLDALARRLEEQGVTARFDRNLGSEALELAVSATEPRGLDAALEALADERIRRVARELLERLGD